MNPTTFFTIFFLLSFLSLLLANNHHRSTSILLGESVLSDSETSKKAHVDEHKAHVDEHHEAKAVSGHEDDPDEHSETKDMVRMAETTLPEVDTDLEAVPLYLVPVFYFRMIRYVGPDVLHRFVHGRLLPFIVMSVIYYAHNYVRHKYGQPVDYDRQGPAPLGPVALIWIFIGMELLAMARFSLFECVSALLKPFPSILYANGSAYFDTVVFGIDVPSLFYLTELFVFPVKNIANYDSDTDMLVPDFEKLTKSWCVSLIASSFVFLGIPVVRRLMLFVPGCLGILTIIGSIQERSPISFLPVIPRFLVIYASLMNDGMKSYVFPRSAYTRFRKYDTPSLTSTLKEIGYADAARIMFLHVVKVYGVPAILLGVLYMVQKTLRFRFLGGSYKVAYACYVSGVAIRFVLNDVLKVMWRRNAPFWLCNNGSFYVDTNIIGGIIRVELLTVLGWMAMRRMNNKVEGWEWLAIIMFVVIDLFRPIVIVAAWGVTGVFMLMSDMKSDMNRLWWFALRSLIVLPWVYVLARRDGIVSWTHRFREEKGLVVTSFEMRAMRRFREEKDLVMTSLEM
jgi:hypothetical protein